MGEFWKGRPESSTVTKRLGEETLGQKPGLPRLTRKLVAYLCPAHGTWPGSNCLDSATQTERGEFHFVEMALERTIATQPKPSTHCGYVGHEAETVNVRLHCLCFSVCGSLSVSALSTNSADVLKALIRSECPELVQVPNSQIRLLYRGVELTDESPITEHWRPSSDEKHLDLHFLVIGPSAVEGFQLALCDVPCPLDLEKRLEECAQGLNRGVLPVLSENGSGGTYFLKNIAGTTLAVSRPQRAHPISACCFE